MSLQVWLAFTETSVGDGNDSEPIHALQVSNIVLQLTVRQFGCLVKPFFV
jgi:hypothetical protein